MKHTISLIIPAYNEEKWIYGCLERALQSKGRKFFEIIVVDNNSTDRTAEIAASLPGVTVLHEKQKGPTFARQRGFEAAKGTIIAFVDSDNHIPADWCERVTREFEENPNLSCLSGPYLYYDLPRWQNFMAKAFWVFSMPFYWVVGYLGVGGNIAIRRDVLVKMHGLDTTILFYGDDTNMARRASTFGKMKFQLGLVMWSSARRFKGQGLLKTELFYIMNFFSEAFLRKPVTTTYEDLR